MLLIHYLSGWLRSIPFSQNWNLPSSLLGLLKKGQTISRDAKWLLGPDTSPFFWAASIHSLWCQLWYVLLWQEFELLHRTCCSYWVFGVWHFCKILNVVFPRIISLMVWILLSLAFTPFVFQHQRPRMMAFWGSDVLIIAAMSLRMGRAGLYVAIDHCKLLA